VVPPSSPGQTHRPPSQVAPGAHRPHTSLVPVLVPEVDRPVLLPLVWWPPVPVLPEVDLPPVELFPPVVSCSPTTATCQQPASTTARAGASFLMTTPRTSQITTPGWAPSNRRAFEVDAVVAPTPQVNAATRRLTPCSAIQRTVATARRPACRARSATPGTAAEPRARFGAGSAVRPAGIEPAAFGFEARSENVGAGRPGSQAFVSFGREGDRASAPLGAIRPDSSPVFGTRSERPTGRGPALAVLEGGRDNLLSVRQVADRLRVSTATVYSLCERGEIPHLRVSNAIRVAPADLDRFIADRRRSGPTGGRGGQS
jgi:excisionase family DNA binding protein